MTQRYHIWTEGCQMNVADSLKLAAGLDRFGCKGRVRRRNQRTAFL
jgi:tRNA A37 methylthiotransferase MiaB